MIKATIGIAFIFIILPMVYGGLLGELSSRFSLRRFYALGAMAELAVFYVLYMVMLHVNRGLRTLTKYYLALSLIAAIALAVIVLLRKQLGTSIRELRARAAAAVAYIKAHPVILIFAAIVIWELYQMTAYTEVAYSDDDTYSPMILDMVASDGFFGIDPDTGYPASVYYQPESKYQLTAWLPFQAFGALVCGVHPLIFTKTILPCALILLHYIIIWELFGVFMGKLTMLQATDEKAHSTEWKNGQDIRPLAMIFYALLLELGWSSLTTTLSYYFLTWLWYGKAFVQFIILPLFLTEYIRNMDDVESAWRHCIRLIVISMAACAASLMGVFLVAAEAAMLGLAALIYRRRELPFAQRFTRTVEAAIALIPQAAVVMMYLFG